MILGSIASGSSGNCIFAGSDTTSLLIDTGVSGRRVTQGLQAIGRKPEEIHGILVTHEHSDHISGLGVISRKYGLPIYATPGTLEAITSCKALGKLPEGLFHEITPWQDFQIGDITVTPLPISHDAAQPTAYRLRSGAKSMAVITDLGTYGDDLIQQLQDLDVLFLEANHDIHMLQAGSYPYYLKQRILGTRGHLSNEDSGRLLNEVLHDGFRAVMLGHLSQENNYEALAYETVRLEVDMADTPYHADDFPIRIARRDSVSELIEF